MRCLSQLRLCLIFWAIASTGGVALKADSTFESKTFWGPAMKGVSAGLWFHSAADNGSIQIVPELRSIETNNGNVAPDVVRLWLPPMPYRYQIDLFDDMGKPVPKTAAGKALGAEFVPEPYRLNHYRHYLTAFLEKGQPRQLYQDMLPLKNYFVINRPGHYRLQFKIGVVWLSGSTTDNKDENATVVFLPPVFVGIDINLKNSLNAATPERSYP